MKKARVKANRKFKDIELDKVIKPNEIYVVSFERAKEIAKHPKNLIEIIDVFDDVSDIVVNDCKEILDSTDTSYTQTMAIYNSLNELKLSQLKDICKEKGIKTSGTKKELIERLIET